MLMLTRVLGRAACGLAFLIGGAGAASAGSFSINPIRLHLSGSQMVGSMTVRNQDTIPTVVQLELMKWSQQDGSDLYSPAKDMLATPPIFTLPPGGSQVIRVGLRGSPDAQVEGAYRMFLREVPSPPTPGFQGLQVVLNISVPVFVKPAVSAMPALQWAAVRAGQGKLKVSLTNGGNAHVRMDSFKMVRPDGLELSGPQIPTYLLPRQSRDWIIDAAATPGTKLQIRAQTASGEMQGEAVVQ